MKKPLSILLSVILILSVLPLASFAATGYGIYICSTQVTSENAADLSVINGVEGTVSYNAETNTLYLENASIDGTTYSNYGLNYATISVFDSISTLNIEFSGTNTIGCEHDTSGYCNAIGGLYTAFVFNGDSDEAVLNVNARTSPTAENGAVRAASITVNKGTVICTAPEEMYEGNHYQNNPYCITLNASDGDLLTVNGGKLICRGYAPVAAGTLEGRVAGNTYLQGSVNYDGTGLVDYDYSTNGYYNSDSEFQSTYRYVQATPDTVEKYNVWVAGKRINAENCEDVFEDGTVSYDRESCTLTLNNANVVSDSEQRLYEEISGIYFGSDGIFNGELTVKVIGNSTVRASDTPTYFGTAGIYLNNSGNILNIELVDGATLNVISGDSEETENFSYGIYAPILNVSGKGTLNAKGGATSAYGVYSSGLFTYSKLSVTGDVTVNATGGTAAQGCTFGLIMENNAQLILGGNAVLNLKGGKRADGADAKWTSVGLGIQENDNHITMNVEGWKGTMTLEGETASLYPAYYFPEYQSSPMVYMEIKSGENRDFVRIESFTEADDETASVDKYVNNYSCQYIKGKKAVINPYRSFPDVNEGDWYYDYVKTCAVFGLVKGYANGKFGPNDKLQRQDFVLILARLFASEGGVNLDEYADKPCGLSDVKDGQYYTLAVNWAVKMGIIKGYDNGKFGVGDPITREQIATIIYRIYGEPDVSEYYEELDAFEDCAKVSPFAKEAMVLAVHYKIITGKNGQYLAPTDNASRAEIAAILLRSFG